MGDIQILHGQQIFSGGSFQNEWDAHKIQIGNEWQRWDLNPRNSLIILHPIGVVPYIWDLWSLLYSWFLAYCCNVPCLCLFKGEVQVQLFFQTQFYREWAAWGSKPGLKLVLQELTYQMLVQKLEESRPEIVKICPRTRPYQRNSFRSCPTTWHFRLLECHKYLSWNPSNTLSRKLSHSGNEMSFCESSSIWGTWCRLSERVHTSILGKINRLFWNGDQYLRHRR